MHPKQIIITAITTLNSNDAAVHSKALCTQRLTWEVPEAAQVLTGICWLAARQCLAVMAQAMSAQWTSCQLQHVGASTTIVWTTLTNH